MQDAQHIAKSAACRACASFDRFKTSSWTYIDMCECLKQHVLVDDDGNLHQPNDDVWVKFKIRGSIFVCLESVGRSLANRVFILVWIFAGENRIHHLLFSFAIVSQFGRIYMRITNL